MDGEVSFELLLAGKDSGWHAWKRQFAEERGEREAIGCEASLCLSVSPPPLPSPRPPAGCEWRSPVVSGALAHIAPDPQVPLPLPPPSPPPCFCLRRAKPERSSPGWPIPASRAQRTARSPPPSAGSAPGRSASTSSGASGRPSGGTSCKSCKRGRRAVLAKG